MAKLHIKRNDTVMIIAGKDKGKTGVVSLVDAKSARVVVEGLNLVTKHVKARSAQEKSEIIKKSAPIDASNVMLICSSCQKPVKVSVKVEIKDGKKIKTRICKKCSVVIEAAKDTKVKSAAKKASKSESDTKKTTRKTAKKKEAEE